MAIEVRSQKSDVRSKKCPKGDRLPVVSAWLLGLSLCLGLPFVACEVTPSEQFTPQLVVHGFVMARGIGVMTNINRTYAIDDKFDTIFPDVSGMVWRGTDTWPLVHDVRDNYNTRQILPSPAYGDTFGIRVAKDGFDTVYGHTVVPDSFRILSPRAGDTVTMSDSMVWTRSRNCAGYYMSLRSIERGETSYYSLPIPNDTTGNNLDSLVFKLPRDMVFLYLFEPGRHTLRVYALDTNYFDWVRAGGFGLGAAAPETTHLSSGLGVFGSLAGESVKVYVKTGTTRARRTERSQKPDVRMQKSNAAAPRVGSDQPVGSSYGEDSDVLAGRRRAALVGRKRTPD